MAGTEFEIEVTYDWHVSPFKDYTVKIYSKWTTEIKIYDDYANPVTNQLFTDGVNAPSEFTGNSYDLVDMIPSWYLPKCSIGDCMGCRYCADIDGGCDAVSAVPDGFSGYNTLLTPPTLEE